MTRLLIADDHPLYRLALTRAVRGVLPEAVIAEAEDMPGVHIESGGEGAAPGIDAGSEPSGIPQVEARWSSGDGAGRRAQLPRSAEE